MWEIAFVYVVAGGAALWGILRRRASWRLGNRRLRVWQDAAVSCGLQGMEISGLGSWSLMIRARAGPVEVRLLDSGGEESKTRIVVVIPGPPADFYRMSILPEPLIARPWVREVEIGDKPFDNTFLLQGPMRLMCALLDAETRRLLLRVNAESRLWISSGKILAEMSDQAIPQLLPVLVDIGRRFDQSKDAPRQRLIDNAHRDPEAGVRLQNLLLLIRELPEDPATVEALRTACSDPSPEIRLRAAKGLGTEGHEVLLELAESMVDDAVCAQAVSILYRELPIARAKAIFDHALRPIQLPIERVKALFDHAWRERRIQTACACLKALNSSGTAMAVDTLAEVLAQQEGELAAAAVQALVTTGSAAAEPPLLSALQREIPDLPDLRVAAAKALGSVGSAAAVLPLKEAAERFSLDRDLRRATRQAIAEIQSRLLGATPGQLSLAAAATGQLSLAQAEAGELSLASNPAGQLSLSSEEPGQPSPGESEEGLKPAQESE